MHNGRPHPGPGSIVSAVAISLIFAPSGASGQQAVGTRFAINTEASLAWYQVNPHTSLMWGTTCPADPFWRAGESRNEPGGTRGLPLPRTGMAMVKDSIIPLWQRARASAVCRRAVRGEFTAPDTVTWVGTSGTIWIKPDSLYSGLNQRDRTANRDVFTVAMWPEIRFVVDSISGITPGDTLKANAYGTFFFRNVATPTISPLRIWRDPLGLRVLARVEMVPIDLVEVYGVSIHGMRLGMSGTWQMIHFGVDAILNPTP